MSKKDKITKADIRKWNEFRDYVKKYSAPPAGRETDSQKEKRIAKLLKNPVAFDQYYFHYNKYPSADFHYRALRKAVNNPYYVGIHNWFRGAAKSETFGVKLPMMLIAAKQIKYGILASKSETMASKLLAPLQLQLEVNQRFIADFGAMKGYGHWADGSFELAGGQTFAACGRSQSPRGAKTAESARPDYIYGDDLDDDDLVLNPRRVDKAVDWFLEALFMTMDMGAGWCVLTGNIIGKYTMLTQILKEWKERKVEFDHTVVNIRDKNGKIAWDGKYTEERVNRVIQILGHRAQKELFNNPVILGKVFKKKWIRYKKMRSLQKYQHFLIHYTDPSAKNTPTSAFKACVLMGLYKDEVHVIKAFCAQTSATEMIRWWYEMDKYVKGKNQVTRGFTEGGLIQEVIMQTAIKQVAKEMGYSVPVMADERRKPEKIGRIMSLQPYFERGHWFFNEDEQKSPGMVELVNQFLMFQQGSKTPNDGPDACEGGLDKLLNLITPDHAPHHGSRPANKKRY